VRRSEEAAQRIHDERRERILAAGASSFARKGLAATKIADIAAGAGVSYGLVYHYYTSKDEIFATLVERAMQATIRITRGALTQPGTPWDRIHFMAGHMVFGVRDAPDQFMVVLQALTNETVPEELRAMAWQQAETSRRAVRDLLAEGQQAGQVVAGDPDQLATTFVACIQGLAIRATFLDYLLPYPPDVETVLRILRP
jgi:AcrR family transcriptional regulator